MSIITSQQQDNIQIIQWDDGKVNSVSMTLLEELDAALDQAEQDQKVVVIAGRPGRFSAGFDLKVMGAGGADAARLVSGGAKISMRMLQFPMPIVMACTGHALAMGGLLLLTADYRIGVAGDFKIGLNEVAIGMTMPWFGVELSRGRMPPQHFNRSVNNAEIYGPEQAIEAGFLDQVVSAEQLLETSLAAAATLGQINMKAHHETKLRVREEMMNNLQQALLKDFGKPI